MRAFYPQITLILGGLGLLAGCSQEPPPRTVSEFLEKPLMLEAAMVRCLQNRTATRYDAECINARQAVQQIEAKEDAARRAELDAQSESKRIALRRTQEAATQARLRAKEQQRLREEAEYLAQFGVAMPVESVSPGASQVSGDPASTTHDEVEQRSGPVGDVVPASDGGNAPGSSTAPEEVPRETDLALLREELQ